jgi:hypothetical protein
VSTFRIKWILAASAALVTAAAIRYVTRHQFPIGYDETMYVNQVLFDREVLVDQGPLVFARKQVGTETWRPPGYRLAAAPVASSRGPRPRRSARFRWLRSSSPRCCSSGRAMNSRGVHRPRWSLAVGCATGSLYSDLQFGTEVTLFPAIALALFGMARVFQREETDRVAGLALFFSAAIGGLSKLSFFVVFLPFMGMAGGSRVARDCASPRRRGRAARHLTMVVLQLAGRAPLCEVRERLPAPRVPWFTSAVVDLSASASRSASPSRSDG